MQRSENKSYDFFLLNKLQKKNVTQIDTTKSKKYLLCLMALNEMNIEKVLIL